jgi:oligopeptide/dipeptide ABC transporter ATP-binding protein
MSSSSETVFLQVNGVVKRFPLGRRSLWDRVTRKPLRFLQAVGGVTFNVSGGETLVVLGESGSGKTTLGRVIVGLEEPDSGEITLSGTKVLPIRKNRRLRGRLQMVFQDPGSSLDPFMTVRDAVSEPLTTAGLPKEAISAQVLEAIESVGLDHTLVDRRAAGLSGGQKQRVSVARAIVSKPKVIVLDEPTSSIDVSIQAQVLNLLIELQRRNGYAYVLITHDPNVARFVGDNIAVMYLGKVVEYGPASTVLQKPKHPYTQALLSSTPKLGEKGIPEAIKGEPPSLIDLPKGCPYVPRCPYAMAVCGESEPGFYEIEGSGAACFLYDSEVMGRTSKKVPG